MFDQIKSKKRLKTEVENLEKEVNSLKDSELSAREAKRRAEDELSKVKHDKKLETEDIKHMIKMKEEKNKLELDKKQVELERENFNKIETIKDEYRNKLEELLKGQIQDVKQIQKDILDRLPNIEVLLGNQDLRKSKD